MVPIRKILCDPSMYYLKCPYSMKPTRIVIHNTANKATAEAEIKHMTTGDKEISFHFAVDEKEAVQGIPLNRNSWHASDGGTGKGNREGISIEICRSYFPKVVDGVVIGDEEVWKKDYKKLFEKAQENAAELTAYLLHEYGWGYDPKRITKHQDYCKKYCPHRTLGDYGWDYFLNLVKQKYSEMYEEDAPMTAAEKKEFDALKTKVETLTKTIDKYEKGKVFDNASVKWTKIDNNFPDWAKPTITKLKDKGYLNGNDKNSLELSYLMLRTLVILDRAGAFDK